MSDRILLDGVLEAKKEGYPKGLDEGEIFELFTADIILKNYGLSYDELEDGVVDGSRDGSIDSIYLFVNGVLVTEDFDFSNYKSQVSIRMYIFQSKRKESFEESVVNGLSSSLPVLFDVSSTNDGPEGLFNEAVISRFKLFSACLSKLAATFPTIEIKIVYANRGVKPSAQMIKKASMLEDKIKDKISNADVSFSFYGARNLYLIARSQTDITIELPVYGSPLSVGNAYVALVNMTNYKEFITKDGSLFERLFEFNIRDYEGGVAVNQQIGETIRNESREIDFWWLNNGVTIIADKVVWQNNSLSIMNPMIVNGLQTSHEIFSHLGSNSSDNRRLLVRVIQTDNEKVRDEVIKATNSQTKIKSSSLRATEEVQRRIEEFLKMKSIYYDRCKNYYKNKGKPAS